MTASLTSISAPAGRPYSVARPERDVQERRGPGFEDVTDPRRDRAPSERARRLVRRLERRTSTSSSRSAAVPGDRPQRPVPEPGARPPLARAEARRHEVQSLGDRGEVRSEVASPGGISLAARSSHRQRRLKLRRQQPRRLTRPRRSDVHQDTHDHLANVQDRPDVSRR